MPNIGPRGPRSDFWTEEERSITLKRLYNEGKSSGQIATLMSQESGQTVTRNMVIGRANRLGLIRAPGQRLWTPALVNRLRGLVREGHGVPTISAFLSQGAEKPINRHMVQRQLAVMGLKTCHQTGEAKPRPRRGCGARPEPRAVPKPISIAIPAPLVSEGVALEALEPGQCRFPVTKDAPFGFCGQPQKADSVYCAGHHQLAYLPAKLKPPRVPSRRPYPGRLAHGWGVAS